MRRCLSPLPPKAIVPVSGQTPVGIEMPHWNAKVPVVPEPLLVAQRIDDSDLIAERIELNRDGPGLVRGCPTRRSRRWRGGVSRSAYRDLLAKRIAPKCNEASERA